MTSHPYNREGSSLLGLPYRVAFNVWRLFPKALRDALSRNPVTRGVKLGIRDLLARHAGRDDIYNEAYYSNMDGEASRSAGAIVDSVMSAYSPASIIDVGCGGGALLAAFRDRKIRVKGLEYSEAALKRCRARGLDVSPFNIERDAGIEMGGFDAAICFEVAEHVPESCADPLVSLLVHLAPRVIFTAATPGQGGGADHINEQPHEYWIAKFAQRGFGLQSRVSESWRESWSRQGVASFYANNIMVFERA